MRPRDTSPEAWQVFLDLQRRMPPGEKLLQIFERSEIMRRMSESALRASYPHADEREIFFRRVRAEWGADLFRRVYGHVLKDEHSARANT